MDFLLLYLLGAMVSVGVAIAEDIRAPFARSELIWFVVWSAILWPVVLGFVLHHAAFPERG